MPVKPKRLTILMIEVEQPEGLTARKLVAETMKHNVITAYSGEEGLDLLERNTVHVVLVHSRLEGMPAREVVRTIRSGDKREMPVMLVLADDDAQVSPEEMGLDATIRPHHVEDLVDFLNKVSLELLDQHPAEHPVTETRGRG